MGLDASPKEANLRPLDSQRNDDTTSLQLWQPRPSRRASVCARFRKVSIWSLTYGLGPLIGLIVIIRYVIVVSHLATEISFMPYLPLSHPTLAYLKYELD